MWPQPIPMNLWSLELAELRNDYGGICGVLLGVLCGVFRDGLRTTASKQIMILMEEENCVETRVETTSNK